MVIAGIRNMNRNGAKLKNPVSSAYPYSNIEVSGKKPKQQT